MSAIERETVVIIAVDRSKHSEDAFNYYADNLHKVDDKVILIHVPEHPTVTTSVGIHISDGEIRKMQDREKEETAEMVEKYTKLIRAKGIPNCEYKTKYGNPGEALVEAAHAACATYVVVGTRGIGLLRRTVMGSVSDYLLHHLNTPVLICRH